MDSQDLAQAIAKLSLAKCQETRELVSAAMMILLKTMPEEDWIATTLKERGNRYNDKVVILKGKK